MLTTVLIILNVKCYVISNPVPVVFSYCARGCPVLPYMVSVSCPCCHGSFLCWCCSAFKLYFRAIINVIIIINQQSHRVVRRLVLPFNTVALNVKNKEINES